MNTTKTIRVVRCDRCGLCFPEDYFSGWGRKYGKGLGPDPVCEGLASNYNRPEVPRGTIPKSPSQIMHPLFVCRGTMSLVDVPEEEAKDNEPVLAVEDPSMSRRAAIMQAHQIIKSPSLKATLKQYA